MPRKRLPLHKRYKINDSGCWEWLGAINRFGYGVCTMKSGSGFITSKPAHRAVYEQLCGPVPKHLQLDHLCRNRACVNPEHLEPVTPAENCRRGLKVRITKESVEQVRALYAAGGTSQPQLAKQFGISRTSIQRIVTGQTWMVDMERQQKTIKGQRGKRIKNVALITEIERLFMAGATLRELVGKFGTSTASMSRLTKHLRRTRELTHDSDSETPSPVNGIGEHSAAEAELSGRN